MKEIDIEGNKYKMDCSAWTMIEYRKVFNRSILDDISIIKGVLATQIIAGELYKQENKDATTIEVEVIAAKSTEDKLEEYINTLLKITWIFLYTADQNIKEYEKWLKDIPKIVISSDWVTEVTELAVTSFQWSKDSRRSK